MGAVDRSFGINNRIQKTNSTFSEMAFSFNHTRPPDCTTGSNNRTLLAFSVMAIDINHTRVKDCGFWLFYEFPFFWCATIFDCISVMCYLLTTNNVKQGTVNKRNCGKYMVMISNQILHIVYDVVLNFETEKKEKRLIYCQFLWDHSLCVYQFMIYLMRTLFYSVSIIE